ncbi:B12-binding domain-containing radical SAM protein [Heliophilum fasciatum]|uniref:Radical SAM superfamily enzyme YgiQ (UPF0313 family) n=1 Tax=Heliophilum fasciatum TaxID=35700 RepID=A0A4R2RM90_9FIRM|nr:radical SAM protein [Heliophilum fasciatum]MCW2278810.1 radical SAM superfamily enzyme YgiQ (UPF0313 family) [Heliophilum fasciatum]TCP64104.1 radical SAM superfamily enzyme YgiQ (UPF0313 family) [Heliophilum fasciatum]
MNMPGHITKEFLNLIKLPNPNTKRLNYLLVMPRIAMNDDTIYMMPYGFCLVSSALKASGRNVFTLNLNYKANPYELLRQVVINNSIDVVATGGLSGQFSLLKEILDTVKSVNQNIITIVGGGIITADPNVAMEALGTADYGIIGEGEITINDLAYALENDEDITGVAGLVLPNGTVTTQRPDIGNLDILPFPDYDGLELTMVLRENLQAQSWFENNAVGITLSRSCPYNCTFCFHSSGTKYRRRSLDNIFEELDWITEKYGASFFIINDELFISNEQFLTAFCNRVKKYNIKYWVQTRVDTVTKEILQLLKDSGCSVISYGVESADNKILKSMRKNITVEQIEKAFDLALEVGLPAYGNLIFGDLEEDQETISNCLTWWKNHRQYNIFILYILTFPGTHLYKVACERGIIKDRVKYLIDNDTQINVTKMSDEEYWDAIRKVELFQIMTANGVDVEFASISEKINVLRSNLEKIVKYKIAIWPTIFSTINLLNSISEMFVNADNVFFVNSAPNDTRLQGIERFGKTVFGPDIILERNIDIVLYAYTQTASAERIYERICKVIRDQYPQIKRVIRLSELFDLDFIC